MNGINGSQMKLTHAFYLLKISYGLLFIVVGIDKFFNFVVNWGQYVNPMILSTLHIEYAKFKFFLAAVEIIIGLLILGRQAKWTRIGAYLAAAWFLIIAVQLLLMWKFVDIAARDTLLAIGAISLAWLTEARQ